MPARPKKASPISKRLYPLTLLAIGILLTGCGPGPTAAATPTTPAAVDGPLQVDVVQPPDENVLKISVSSAKRAGRQITLVLNGTYTGTRTTQWDQTTVDATAGGSACSVFADNGFPTGASRPGSTVTGTWTIACEVPGPVSVRVDPFGGLVDGDTGTRITLH
jgi:hypothetical protein